MQKTNYTIRTMTRSELDLAVEWAAAEGWNPGLHDPDSFYTADSSGFLIGSIDKEPVAVISAVKYQHNFGFIGFYIVKPEYRGKGYGIQIWNEAMKQLKGRNIGLDGVIDQQDNYKKSGFKLAYRNIRYEGIIETTPPSDTSVIDLSTVPFETIENYDRHFFPAKRTTFLQSWIQMPDCAALGMVQHGQLVGYGVIRPCRSGYKIGPLFADSPEMAESLFNALTSRAKPGESVYLDIPDPNQEALALVNRHNMQMVFETARMYTGDAPNLPLDRLYGVTTFELG